MGLCHMRGHVGGGGGLGHGGGPWAASPAAPGGRRRREALGGGGRPPRPGLPVETPETPVTASQKPLRARGRRLRSTSPAKTHGERDRKRGRAGRGGPRYGADVLQGADVRAPGMAMAAGRAGPEVAGH